MTAVPAIVEKKYFRRFAQLCIDENSKEISIFFGFENVLLIPFPIDRPRLGPNLRFKDDVSECGLVIDVMSGRIKRALISRNKDINVHRDATFESFWSDQLFWKAVESLESERDFSIFALSPLETVNDHQWSGRPPITSIARTGDEWHQTVPYQCEPTVWRVFALDNDSADQFILMLSHIPRGEVFHIATAVEAIIEAARGVLDPYRDKISELTSGEAYSPVDDGEKGQAAWDNLFRSLQTEVLDAQSGILDAVERFNKDPVLDYYEGRQASKEKMRTQSASSHAASVARTRRLRWTLGITVSVSLFVAGLAGLAYQSSISYYQRTLLSEGGREAIGSSYGPQCMLLHIGYARIQKNSANDFMLKADKLITVFNESSYFYPEYEFKKGEIFTPLIFNRENKKNPVTLINSNYTSKIDGKFVFFAPSANSLTSTYYIYTNNFYANDYVPLSAPGSCV